MKFCKKCGAQAEDNVKFCTECGQSFGNDSPSDAASDNDSPVKDISTKNTNQKPQRKKRNVVIISISLAVALIAAIVIVFFVPRKTNIRLNDLKDMNEFQIRLLFGRPDTSTEGSLVYRNRISFYGNEIDSLTYYKDDHSLKIYMNESTGLYAWGKISKHSEEIDKDFKYLNATSTYSNISWMVYEYRYNSAHIEVDHWYEYYRILTSGEKHIYPEYWSIDIDFS